MLRAFIASAIGWFHHHHHRPGGGQGETIRFGSLEFPAVPRDGLWAPPPFQPSQSFHFGNLEFVTDQLGALHLCEKDASTDSYVWETHRTMHGRQSAPQFVGMTGSYLASIHDLLCDEDPLSDASST